MTDPYVQPTGDRCLLKIRHAGSEISRLGQLVVSVPEASTASGKAELVVGLPGRVSATKVLRAGGAILYETPDEGLLEVRIFEIQLYTVHVLVSRVAPAAGLAAGYVAKVEENTAFRPDEVARIESGLTEVRAAVDARSDLTPEQIDYLQEKLDEIQEAATRVGRKDWMNLAIGTLTNVIVTGAIGSDAARAIFQALGAALAWLFGGLRLLA